MWAFGRYDLGLSDEEFWNLSISEFNALSLRHNTRIRQEEFQIAQIAAILANSNRDPKRQPQPYEVKDFVLSLQGKRLRQSIVKPIDPEKQAALWKELFRGIAEQKHLPVKEA